MIIGETKLKKGILIKINYNDKNNASINLKNISSGKGSNVISNFEVNFTVNNNDYCYDLTSLLKEEKKYLDNIFKKTMVVINKAIKNYNISNYESNDEWGFYGTSLSFKIISHK